MSSPAHLCSVGSCLPCSIFRARFSEVQANIDTLPEVLNWCYPDKLPGTLFDWLHSGKSSKQRILCLDAEDLCSLSWWARMHNCSSFSALLRALAARSVYFRVDVQELFSAYIETSDLCGVQACLRSPRIKIDQADRRLVTPLSHALDIYAEATCGSSIRKQVAIVQAIYRRSPNMDAADMHGYTPLQRIKDTGLVLSA